MKFTIVYDNDLFRKDIGLESDWGFSHTAEQSGNIIGSIGGFRGFKSFSVLEEFDTSCPCHCTQYKREIQQYYPETYISNGVGKIIEI